MHGVLGFVLAVTSTQTVYDTVYEHIKRLAPQPDAVAPVSGLVLRRDVMELRLDSGSAYLLTPVAGRIVGVVFTGRGSMSFVPPLTVEQFNLQRVMGDSTISGPITAAVFIFADSTQPELGRSLQFGRGPPSAADLRPALGPVGDALDYIVDGSGHSATESLMAALLNNTTTGYFAAYVKRSRGESVMFEFDPTRAEEVALYRRGKMQGQRTETVCQFQRAEDLVNNVSVAAKQPESLIVDGHDVDASIDGNYKFSARVTERLIGRQDRQQWASFELYSELEVDSVTTDTGTPLTFYRRERQPALWVRFPRPVAPGDTVNLRFVYHGGLIGFGSALEDLGITADMKRELGIMLDGWAYIKATSTWFPRYSFVQSTPVTMTFHTPKNFQFATIGRLVDSSTTGNVKTTRWASEAPTRQVSFNIGKFDELEIRDPRIPPVTVQVNADAHQSIRRVIVSARNPQESVGADVAGSLSFFTKMYGTPLFQHYFATETPYYHGQAFPGMIHLSWITFLGIRTDGEDEIFRAHEMAHQWWGIGVEPAGYRDAWLAEGFSEFSGMWYMQMVLNNNDKYLKALRRAREEIRRDRAKAAPIGIGYRAAESWRGDYQLITYKKGAWVVHMLRNLLLNVRTMNEDRFQTMMSTFYETYRGKRASTVDFQRMVEKAVGQPMDWFFDEWVYGTAVPTYTFSYNVVPDSAGFVAHLRVRQSDVPETFKMYVPVLITLPEGEGIVRILVKGPTTDATIRLPGMPKSLQLNPLESVLADVKTESWTEHQ
ncbi:MAG TPA: M1 family aminopeptidase [Gemmatimonadales bacterium]|nr:M1 family aminopeptidase [Gemmatimonadales bacterium]